VIVASVGNALCGVPEAPNDMATTTRPKERQSPRQPVPYRDSILRTSTMNAEQFPQLPNELKSLAADLAALAPASGNLGRDELMYRAGWEACAAAAGQGAFIGGGNPRAATFDQYVHSVQTHARTWLWPLCTAGLLLVTATLAVLLAMRDEPDVRIVYIEKPADTAIEQPRDAIAAEGTQQIERAQQNDSARERAAARDRAAIVRRLGDDYLSLRERVLAFGVDVLPTHTPAALPEASESGRDLRYGSMIGRFISS
jgi:hypothetical protein